MQNHPAVRRKQYILVSTQQDEVKDCFGHNCFSQKYFAEKNFAKKYSTKKYYTKKYFADKYVGVLVSIKMKWRTALVTVAILFHLQLPTEAIKKPYVETYWESWIPGVSPKFFQLEKTLMKLASQFEWLQSQEHLNLQPQLLRNTQMTLGPSSKMSQLDLLGLVLG